MTSPIANLKKTCLKPEKLINPKNKDAVEKGNSRRNSIEEDVEKIRRNSVTEKENTIEQMTKRMSFLEWEVKDIKEELSKAVKLINRKDDEIEFLKNQILQQEEKNIQSDSGKWKRDEDFIKEQLEKLDETLGGIFPKKDKKFLFKGDLMSPSDGCVDEKRKMCKEMYNNPPKSIPRKEPQNNSPLYEAKRDKFIALNQNRKKQKMYEYDMDQIKDEGLDINKLLDDQFEDYAENLTDSSSTVLQKRRSSTDTEYSHLTHKISEMEKFLSDYGMMWVGEKKLADKKKGDRIFETTVGFTPNFDKLIMILSELNERTSSENHIMVKGNKAKFEKAKMVNLTLYNDGMQLEDGPFRDYASDSVKEFFMDLEEGYYPTEMKDKYPEGVIFKNITYHEAPSAPGLTRNIIIGPLESQSEPIIVHDYNPQRDRPQVFYDYIPPKDEVVQDTNQGELKTNIKGGVQDDSKINVELGNGGVKNYTSEYQDAFGNTDKIFEQIEKKEKSPPPIKIDLREKYDSIMLLGSDKLGTDNITEGKDQNSPLFKALMVENEPKWILLNDRTSRDQIQLGLKSYDGNVTYTGYMHPDDNLGEIWNLTKLSREDFDITVEGKVMDRDVPLKNYNIYDDVLLHILRKKKEINFQEEDSRSFRPSSGTTKEKIYSLSSFSEIGSIRPMISEDSFSSS